MLILLLLIVSLIFPYVIVTLVVWETCRHFFNLEFTPCKAEQPLMRHKVTEKGSTRRVKHTGHLFRKNLQ